MESQLNPQKTGDYRCETIIAGCYLVAVHRRLRFGEERRAVAARAGVARPALHLASLKSQRHRPYFIQTSILWMNIDNRYNLSALNHPTKRSDKAFPSEAAWRCFEDGLVEPSSAASFPLTEL